MTTPVNDTIALADRIERGLLYLTGDGPLLESEHCLIVAALRANRAATEVPDETAIRHVAEEIADLAVGERHNELMYETICNFAADQIAALYPCSPGSGELDRLRERCDSYKGQVEAGSIAIQHLQGEIDRLRHPWRAVDAMDWDFVISALPLGGRGRFWRAVLTEMRDALSSG